MPISISGDGTITGVSVGGLPDGCVDNGTLANNSVNSNEIVNGAVGSAELADDSVGAAQIADFFSTNGLTLGGLRIQTGVFNLPSSVADAGNDLTYPGARYYTSVTFSVTGFAATPSLNVSIASGYHEATAGGVHESQHTSSQCKQYFYSHRAAGIQSEEVYWVAIGEAS